MRRILAIAAAGALTLGLLGGAGLATATSDPVHATVITDIGCGLAPQDGIGAQLFTDESHAVLTPSGNVSLKCYFKVPDTLVPAKAVRHEGFLCGTPWGLTTDSWSVVDAGGGAVLSCMIKPPKT